MEVKTDCVRPWHVYTFLFGVFWLLSGYFDNFIISFILCVIGGFVSEIINKSIPIQFRPLSPEQPEAPQVSSQSPPQEALLDSFYDKPLPPEPVIDETEEAILEDAAAPPQYQEVRSPSPMEEEDQQQQQQDEEESEHVPEPQIQSPTPIPVVESTPESEIRPSTPVEEAKHTPEPMIRPPSPIEVVEHLPERESPVEKEAEFFGSDPIPAEAEASLSALKEQFNAKDSPSESESDNEEVDPEPLTKPAEEESRGHYGHSAGLSLEPEPEKEPELEERFKDHNLLDDEIPKQPLSSPPEQEDVVIPVIEQQSESTEAQYGHQKDDAYSDIQHKTEETSAKSDPIDFDDDCMEDQEDLIRKKREVVEDDFEASFEKERTPPKSMSPEQESKTILEDMPHIPNRNSDTFEPNVMEQLKEEYTSNVEKAKEILPDSLVNPSDSPTKSRDSSDDEDKPEPETAKASEEPFSFSKIGDKLEEMKDDIMGHFTNKNDSDHEKDEGEKAEEKKPEEEKESEIKVDDLQPKSSSPTDPFQDLLEKKHDEHDLSVLEKKSPSPSPSQENLTMADARRSPLEPELSTSAQNQAQVMDLLDDAQKESMSPKSVSPIGNEMAQPDHSKEGLSVEDEDEISDPLEAQRKAYEQVARDQGGSDALVRPLDVLSVSTTDTNADDISHRAVFGDDQEHDADQLDEVLDRQEDNDQSSKDSGSETSDNLKMSPDESPKGIMGLGSQLANFANENIIEPVKDSIHPAPAKADTPPAIDIDLNDPLVEVAATKIQAAFKGYRTRSQMKMTT
ncbi:hypothetical protein TCAL_08765 [Tigriopus californicus]|uniref:Uncharacterized protein n=1 Tax=Tigriopus californicus TaxID=6832 RepID=A0A553PKR8_TIGCA|nr:nucleolar and coiled-body phosphoprotein 1-like [Tigriopus californicus]XP_059096476.1 nucleolar and coiled-body phosphoprotein 1-like [Tigriopus californicus]XP_059096477.1 nucleolar and coiled-body phosphoprotein 1-like [Tigriopus californicus]TRY78276.1 hypothetical protein TCAL_08765 [Tigriopus californicus]